MRTSLSKSEFASALGMKADAVFVKKMFNIVDKDSDGRISFQVTFKSICFVEELIQFYFCHFFCDQSVDYKQMSCVFLNKIVGN